MILLNIERIEKMTTEDFFYLIDLERTLLNGLPAFWKGNFHGYTYKIEFAGIFSHEQAESIIKSDKDETTVKISLKQVERILQTKSYIE